MLLRWCEDFAAPRLHHPSPPSPLILIYHLLREQQSTQAASRASSQCSEPRSGRALARPVRSPPAADLQRYVHLLRATSKAPMRPTNITDELNGSDAHAQWPLEAVLKLYSSCAGLRGTPEAFRDSALTSRLLHTATNHTRRRKRLRSWLCLRDQGPAYRGVLHLGTENPWRARGDRSRRDWPCPHCRV